MTIPWGKIAAFGSLLTLLAVAPYLFGMVSITSSMSMQNADVAMLEQAVYLFAGAVKAMVPLTVVGAFVFVFFKFAGEMA
ncbi:hypothetical protein [Halomicrobium sp. LC1Hm]|uniref:hypothetical protein n=1 Tax=Halomicrobium sp. LC1Hm TaxID=2610902 RepID=UPI0012984BF0|nr:hypothetical protein [Halomicrobium sp. LC1Hm]